MNEQRRVRISSDTVAAYATLNDTNVADAVWNAMPLEVRMRTWGDELYGPVPLSLQLEAPQEEVELGDLAFWPPGHALCIFFGLTPASTGDKPRAASNVTVFGRVESDPGVFRLVQDGQKLRFEQAGFVGPESEPPLSAQRGQLPGVDVCVEEDGGAKFNEEPVYGTEDDCPPEP
ncbi:MAG: hypothetical protein GX600_00580 [Dehalococcoidia bacterium]|nr:hypothetical protein [Dehalococcoidia bacterium]